VHSAYEPFRIHTSEETKILWCQQPKLKNLRYEYHVSIRKFLVPRMFSHLLTNTTHLRLFCRCVFFDTEALVAIMKSDRYTPCASLHPSGNSILMHYSRHDVTYNLPLSTAITLLSRCRPVLGARAKELLEHMEKHAVEPTYASNRSLACFLSKQRSVVFDHIMLHGLTTPSHWSFETQLYVCIFRCIGVDLTKHKVKAVRRKSSGTKSRLKSPWGLCPKR